LPLGFGSLAEGRSQDLRVSSTSLDMLGSDTERSAAKVEWEPGPSREAGIRVASESQIRTQGGRSRVRKASVEIAQCVLAVPPGIEQPTSYIRPLRSMLWAFSQYSSNGLSEWAGDGD
jgi:hypothetical protein